MRSSCALGPPVAGCLGTIGPDSAGPFTATERSLPYPEAIEEFNRTVLEEVSEREQGPRVEPAGTSLHVPKYPIESVDNALRMLLLIGTRPDVRLSDMARELGVARSTAHRLMQMLEFYGFAVRDPATRRYKAGPILTMAGAQLVGDLDIVGIARPHLEQLVRETRETVHLLFLRQDGRVVCLDSIEGPQMLRIGTRTGQVLPAQATSGGLALLATLEEPAVEAMYPDEHLETFTEHSFTSRSDLAKELATVRERGFAFSERRFLNDVGGIAVVLPDPSIRVAVAVAVPVSRLNTEVQAELVRATREAIDRVVAACRAQRELFRAHHAN
jgi:DNA-binding IclR family transcriptional regulator